MNRISYSCLFILCLLLAPLKSSGQNTTYTDTQNHYTVALPADWQMEMHYKSACFLAFRPMVSEGEKKVENVVLSKVYDPAATDLQSAYANALNSNKLKELAFKLVEEGTLKKGAGKWYVETHKSYKTDETVQLLIVIYYHDNVPFILTCTASPQTFAGYKAVFLRIAESVTFR